MRNVFFSALLLMACSLSVKAAEKGVSSPDGRLMVVVSDDGGQAAYRVLLDGSEVIGRSPLGVVTNVADLTKDVVLEAFDTREVTDNYELCTIKQRRVAYVANEAVCGFVQGGKRLMDIIFRVSNRDVALRYRLLPKGETRVCVVEREATGFCVPEGTTTFMAPQSKPMGGFARTSPSYETPYGTDEAVGRKGWGEGYTFPCLMKVAPHSAPEGATIPRKSATHAHKSNEAPSGAVGGAWLLISETGVDGSYCGSRLLNEGGGAYRIGFPQAGEMNGVGSVTPMVALPGVTPWRTLTIGTSLANIVETTVAFDLVAPKYEAKKDYTYGKGSWSWIIGMDPSCNFDEQKRYIDFSADMGYQSVLIDAFWDRQIGYERIEQLARYGREKGVGLFLWYNSNGAWNDAPQTPIGKMNNAIERRKEMAWMERTGIRGIKVDFFGGDKQPMMQLYEDILADANEHGLMVIFHGCTLPRGWERMYPNYVASEAVLASENLHFSQDFCNVEARNATIHPFVRNAVGAMDFGGSALNKHYGADNQHGTRRMTSDVFALATAVLFQSSVQHFALAPNNLTDAPAWAIDFMKTVPTTWDEVRYIDGYPGRYVVLARRSGDQWYVAGVNAEQKPLKVVLTLPMFDKGAQLRMYSDDAQLNGSVKTVKLNKKQQLTVTIPCNGGVVLK